MRTGREGQDFSSGFGEEMAEVPVLGFGRGDVGRVVEAKVAPGGGFGGVAPAGVAGRADQHLAERSGHGLGGH